MSRIFSNTGALLKFQARLNYNGFRSEDLNSLHPSYYYHMNDVVRTHNETLDVYLRDKYFPSIPSPNAVDPDVQKLQAQLLALQNQHREVISNTYSNLTAKRANWRKEVGKIPTGTHQGLRARFSRLKFSREQFERVDSVRKTVDEIHHGLVKFEDDAPSKAHMRRQFLKIMSKDIHGKSYSDYRGLASLNYPAKWKKVSELISKDYTDLEKLLHDISNHRFWDTFQYRKEYIRDYKQKPSSENYIRFSYQGRKRFFDYEVGETVKDLTKHISQRTGLETNKFRLSLGGTTPRKENLLSNYSTEDIFRVEVN
jgi:hypothetical protein